MPPEDTKLQILKQSHSKRDQVVATESVYVITANGSNQSGYSLAAILRQLYIDLTGLVKRLELPGGGVRVRAGMDSGRGLLFIGGQVLLC